MTKIEYSPRKKITPTGPDVLFKRIAGIYPLTGDVPESRDNIEKPIIPDDRPLPERSFAALLPWKRFDPEYKQLVCTDERQRGVALEIIPTDLEARPDKEIDDAAEKISIALKTIPEHSYPWVVQCYIQNESVHSLIYHLKQYINRHTKENDFSKAYIDAIKKHLGIISRDKGIFIDGKTDLPWRAKFRRIRVVLYRERGIKPAHPDELNSVALRFSEALKEAGVLTRVMSGEDIREWLLPWLSGEGNEAYSYLEEHPYPVEAEINGMLPPSFDLAEICLKGRSVRSDFEANTWRFGRQLNRYITLQPIRIVPRPGHLILERTNSKSAMIDKLPEGAVMNMTFSVEPRDLIEKRLLNIINASIGTSSESSLSKDQCNKALEWMAKDQRLISWSSGIYLNADNIHDLNKQTILAISSADAAGLNAIEPEDDLYRLDSYVRNLPMKYSSEYDIKNGQRSRSAWHEHVARLLPFYGRGSGTNNLGTLLYNRIGEPLSFDPLNENDRTKNAHLLLLGPTGSGKTAILNKLLMHTMAVHRPRLFIVTALPTFGLLAKHYEKHGLSVNYMTINPSEDVSLPPFADIGLLNMDRQSVEHDDELDTERDVLGEAEISAKLMITGGDREEEKRFTRVHKTILRASIVNAAEKLKDRPGKQALTEDIITALIDYSENYCQNEEQKKIAQTVAKSMELYCDGFEGRLFNRPGEAWPDVDVTIVELGILARRGYGDKMAIAVTGLMSRINNIVEKKQNDKRYTIACFDEAHLQVQNPLVSPYMNSISAMWRTYGAWLWLATQNLHQFPDESKQLLAQPEWWICMSTDEDDVNQISRFKNLSDEQKALLKSARKESGKYTEGVVMSKKLLALFRNVPPSIVLSLGQTEKHEKAERARLMKLNNCDPLRAAEIVAEKIDEARSSFMAHAESSR